MSEEDIYYMDIDTVMDVWDGESFIEKTRIYQLMFDRDDIDDQFFVEDIPSTVNMTVTHKVERDWEMAVWKRG